MKGSSDDKAVLIVAALWILSVLIHWLAGWR